MLNVTTRSWIIQGQQFLPKTIGTLLFLLFSLALSAQPFICNSETAAPLPLGSRGPDDALCPSVTFANYDDVLPFTIRVNIHFYPDPDYSNFDVQTGKMAAAQLIGLANEELRTLAQNERPGPGGVLAPLVPSTKFQYEIYSEPSNPEDPHGGIWFHPEQLGAST